MKIKILILLFITQSMFASDQEPSRLRRAGSHIADHYQKYAVGGVAIGALLLRRRVRDAWWVSRAAFDKRMNITDNKILTLKLSQDHMRRELVASRRKLLGRMTRLANSMEKKVDLSKEEILQKINVFEKEINELVAKTDATNQQQFDFVKQELEVLRELANRLDSVESNLSQKIDDGVGAILRELQKNK